MTNDSQAHWSVTDRIWNLAHFFGTAAKEIFEGVRRDRIPAHRYCYVGIFLALALIGHLDDPIMRALHLKFHFPHALRMMLAYSLLVSGWVIWGFRQAFQRNEILSKLTDAFEAAKLKCNGRYPDLIEDAAIDDHVRKLRLKTNGVTKSEIEAAREKIESLLNVSVVRITQEDGDKSRVDIVYAYRDLPRLAYLEDRDRYMDAEIPIGLAHEGPLAVNLRDVGHILVCGQTGGGKSNWLKLATSVLAVNNPEAEILFLDFKGGMESSDLKQEMSRLREDIGYHNGTRACIDKLTELGCSLETRLKQLADAGATSLDDYQTRLAARGPIQEQIRSDQFGRRLFVIVDEVAQLYVRDASLSSTDAKTARAAVNRIARQGRAAGVHLVLATQKPDNSNFDPTVKANLPGVLCFPMSNQASSVAAIGSKRAYELNPDIKGRAVWKFGPKVEEVQTYLFN